PKAAVSNRSNAVPYSITSSAATSSLSGTVRPSILAVSALMTSSNFVDCITGRSAGFTPLRMRPVLDTHLTECIRQACSVTHQPAGFGILTHRIYRRNRVARRQLGQLDSSADEKRTGADVEDVGPLAYKVREGRVDLAAGAGAENLDL